MSEEIAPEPSMADRNTVKAMSGNRTVISGMTDNRYNSIINRWEGYVKTHTDKYDWAPSDPDFPAVRGIVERLAAAEIRWMFDPGDKTAAAYHKEAMATLEQFTLSSEAAGGPKTVLEVRPFDSYPANPSKTPFTGYKKHVGTSGEADMRFWT